MKIMKVFNCFLNQIPKFCIFALFLLFPYVTYAEVYYKCVGESFTIPSPAKDIQNPPYDINMKWSCDENKVTVQEKYDGGATVVIDKYFTSTAIIKCHVTGSGLNKTIYHQLNCKPIYLQGLNDITMEIGEDREIKWTFSPSGQKKPKIVWETSNYDVVSVSESGYLHAKSSGTSTITAKNNSGPDESFLVTVKNDPYKIRLFASPVAGTVEKGTIVYITSKAGSSNLSGVDIYYTLNGENPSQYSTKYTSSGITIDRDCTLKAIGYKNGYKTSEILSADYRLFLHPESITVYPKEKTIYVDETCELSSYINPYNATTEVYWYSENPNIASVNKNYSNAKVLALKEGKTKIYAKTSNDKKDYCELTVLPVPLYDIISASVGLGHCLAVKTDGSLWTWGHNNYGQLCNGNKKDQNTPKKVMEGVSYAKADFLNTIILKTDGSLWVCGNNQYWNLGINASQTGLKKVLEDVLSVFAEEKCTFAVKKDGSLWSCGYTTSGIGYIHTNTYYLFTKIMENVSSVSASDAHSLVVKKDGSLWACGKNKYGELGDGTGANYDIHVKIMDDVSDVAVGLYHSLILKKDGSLLACGWNKYGQLGDGTGINKFSPKKIADNVHSIAARENHSFFIKKDGSLWAFGENSYGQLGDGTTSDRYTPVKIADGVSSVKAYSSNTYIIKNDGSLWVFGDNYIGQLGIENVKKILHPVKLMESVKSVAGHDKSGTTLIVKKDGSLWACGSNDYGQLGDGTLESKYIPLKIIDGANKCVAAINSANFPDTNFRNYLLSQSYGNDSELSEDEINNVKTINVPNMNINNLKGIEYFTHLETLDCYNNKLTSLDVSKNTALTSLQCFSNQLEYLDVSKLSALNNLSCAYNKLKSLDVSKNTALTSLECAGNELTALDVSRNVALNYLGCHGNKIKGVAMDNLIQSLPVNKTNETHYLRVHSNSKNETNECTKKQVEAAKARGWTPAYEKDRKWVEYEGSDDNTYKSIGKGVLRDYFFKDETDVEILQDQKEKNYFKILRPYDGITNSFKGENYRGAEEMEIVILGPGWTLNGIPITINGIICYDDINTGYYDNNYETFIKICHPIAFTDYKSEEYWTHNKVLSYQENGLPEKIQLAPLYNIEDIGYWDYTQEDNVVIITFPKATSGIDDVKIDDQNNNNRIFNMSGQKLDKPQKGINIINGRKVVVK